MLTVSHLQFENVFLNIQGLVFDLYHLGILSDDLRTKRVPDSLAIAREQERLLNKECSENVFEILG